MCNMKGRYLKPRHAALPLAALIISIASTPTRAAEIEGVSFPARYEVAGSRLDLTCVGLLRYKLFIKAYVAALYLGSGARSQDVFDDVPRRLELSYFWNINGADFGKAGEQILEQNVDAATLARLRPRLDQISALYESVKPGDRYSLTYIPGRGTELALNGQPKGIVEGADFAAAYFRIWLGERPIDTALRDQLLKCSQTAMPGADPGLVASAAQVLTR